MEEGMYVVCILSHSSEVQPVLKFVVSILHNMS